jgi:hypothetical protein
MAEINIARALSDSRLLGAGLGDAASWSVWQVVLKAAFGITLSAEEAKTFADIAASVKASAAWC